jgi:predicted permease
MPDWKKEIRERLAGLRLAPTREVEIVEELAHYLEDYYEDLLANGMTAETARRSTIEALNQSDLLKELGTVERPGTQEPVVLGASSSNLLRDLLRDVRFGVRMLGKSKGFTIVAVLSLALGIGANTALFSVVDAVLLKTLPVPEPDKLVLFAWQAGRPFRVSGMSGTSNVPGPPGMRTLSLFRYEVFQRMRETQTRSTESPLSDLFAFAPLEDISAVISDQAEIVNGQAVSGNYYAGLKMQPSLGRAITGEDDKAGAPPVVVLSHQFWQDRFDANAGMIGQSLKLNKHSFTIIGVTPPAFTGTSQVDYRPALTVPFASEPLLLGDRSNLGTADEPGVWWINLMGRLKPDASYEQARDSLNGAFQATALELMPPPRVANQPAQLEPKDYPRLIAESGSRGMLDHRRRYSPTIYGLFIVVTLVLLIACANVANLLLARAALRSAEINVRLAVGAGRWRLIRQLLTESLLLALVVAVGVLFAYWGKSALLTLTDKDTGILPNDLELTLNWRVLAFTLAVSLLTGVLFGLAPAWRATSQDLATTLKQSRRTTGAVSRLSKGLIVAQVALSLLLLVGAGLFIRTLYNLQRVNFGFNQENLLLFRLQPRQNGYKDERLVRFYQQLLARLDNLPDVRSATLSRVPLIADENWFCNILLPGETEQTDTNHDTMRQMASENYFATLEIPLLRGRTFTAQDDQHAPKVAIVNQTFAHEFFPNDDPLVKHVNIEGEPEVEIIGLVADTKYRSQREEIKPLLYTPWQQEDRALGTVYFALRTGGEPAALADTVRQVVGELDSNLPVTEVTTQTARAQTTLGPERLSARLLSFFGALALLLAAIGLSGVLAYSVAQRTNEIGIRMALGARASDVLRLVIWQGTKLVLLGLAVGALSGFALTRLLVSQYFASSDWQRQMAEQLYDVKATDPLTFAAIASLLLVGLIACWLPARRAAEVDPLEALRYE